MVCGFDWCSLKEVVCRPAVSQFSFFMVHIKKLIEFKNRINGLISKTWIKPVSDAFYFVTKVSVKGFKLGFKPKTLFCVQKSIFYCDLAFIALYSMKWKTDE